jgi:DNA polymerase III subunit epsilon
MQLNLRNPLVFFDLETTGVNVNSDRIVEISYLKVHPNGNEEIKTFRVNPGIPIPKEASDLHHITDEDVANCPSFKEIGKNIAKDLEGCDLAGFNSNRFDVPMLVEEFLRNDIDVDFTKRKLIDVQVIFHKMEQRTLSAAYKFYCGLDLEGAHGAEADTKATYEVLKSQLDRYPDLQNNIQFLSEFSSHNRNVDFAGKIILNDKDVEVFNFGKYKDVPVEDILKRDSGYYGWMMQGDFSLNTKNVLTRIRLRTLNK